MNSLVLYAIAIVIYLVAIKILGMCVEWRDLRDKRIRRDRNFDGFAQYRATDDGARIPSEPYPQDSSLKGN